MDEKLLPCPFCGGSAALHLWHKENDGTRYSVGCTRCGAVLTHWNHTSEGARTGAIAAWNCRPSPESEAGSDRFLKDALFACLKEGRTEAIYQGVMVEGGKFARVQFSIGEAGSAPAIRTGGEG